MASNGSTVPGTEPERTGHAGLIHQLTIAGWLLLGGELGFILFQLQRARTVDGSRFATAWSQRIEVLGFMTLPPNLVVLAPAAAAAAVATFLAGSTRDQWLDVLLRVIAAVAIVMFFTAVAAIIEIFTRSGEVEFDSIFLRLGGMGLASGIALVCRAADQS